VSGVVVVAGGVVGWDSGIGAVEDSDDVEDDDEGDGEAVSSIVFWQADSANAPANAAVATSRDFVMELLRALVEEPFGSHANAPRATLARLSFADLSVPSSLDAISTARAKMIGTAARRGSLPQTRRAQTPCSLCVMTQAMSVIRSRTHKRPARIPKSGER
jgi:hypothetical protein